MVSRGYLIGEYQRQKPEVSETAEIIAHLNDFGTPYKIKGKKASQFNWLVGEFYPPFLVGLNIGEKSLDMTIACSADANLHGKTDKALPTKLAELIEKYNFEQI